MSNTPTTAVRIFLIDDHPTMRAGLAMLLSHVGYTICGEAENQAELLERIDSCDADVVLLDLSLAEENGLDLLDALQQRNIAALVYSMHENWGTIEQAFKRGAQGYVTKREGPNVLLEALAEIASGKRYISPRASHGLASRVLSDEPAAQGILSAREEQIMTCSAKAKPTTTLPTSSISAPTPCRHTMRAFRKS